MEPTPATMRRRSSLWRVVPVFAKACFRWLRAVLTVTPRWRHGEQEEALPVEPLAERLRQAIAERRADPAH